MFFTGLTMLSSFTNAVPLSAAPLNTNRLNAIPLSCISMNNQPCKARPETLNINRKNPIFYRLFYLYFVPDVIKDLNVKVLSLMSRTNEKKIYKM